MATLLFDYGGTLDSAACHWSHVLLEGFRQAERECCSALRVVQGELWRAAYVYGERTLAQQNGVKPTDTFKQLLRKKVNLELDYLYQQGALQFTCAQQSDIAECVAQYGDQMARYHTQRSTGLLTALQQRGHRLVLVSNFYGNLATVLQDYGLTEFFPHVVESAVAGLRKPDPAIWQMGISQSGQSPEDCIAIGDSYSKDIVPAHSLGLRTIWFEGRAWSAAKRDRTLPTHIIHDLEQLLQIL